MSSPIIRPDPSEYDPYYHRYISLVPDTPFLDVMEDQARSFAALLRRSEGRGDFSYEPGKWTVKELVGHLIDSELVFTLRALHIARLDPAPLPPFDQDEWCKQGQFNARSLADLRDSWTHQRQATIRTLAGLPPGHSERVGEANGNPISVRALAFVIPGHLEYHRRVLASNYGVE